MRIVTTASHPIFSFHCILLFLFSSLIFRNTMVKYNYGSNRIPSGI